MAELLLLNPRRRKRRRTRLTARRRRRNPFAAFARNRNAMMANPRRRRRRRNPSHRMSNLRRYVMRNRRNNPTMALTARGIGTQVMNAATGAVGALAVDAVMGQVNNFLPPALKTPFVYPVVKMGAAIGLGVLARPLLPRHAGLMAAGSMTVTMRDFLRGFLPDALPMGYVNPGYIPGSGTMATQLMQPGVGMRGRRMGEYVGMGGMGRVGEYVGASAELNGLGMQAYR